ncbi:DMT family transporter [Sphingobium phenoxybenzoativorans]|uniref:DMT family transporter n=1 Tax=Sphingobium phenoxybenzoativorans TaxID=1592790 RepID=A0A975Q2N9_9SPHN|nr:DMT family transporter [Sphingobium phenoxybenzoativorans]QUT06657.1 DMT family transporter [Sphingobium phenoxybenzoativorans]
MDSAASHTKAVALPVAFAVCCGGVALFSVMDAAMKGLSLAIGVYNALLWRAVAGTLIGVIGMAALRNPWPSASTLRIHMIRGAVVAVMAFLFFFGLTHLPMAEAIGLSFLAPIIALYLAALLLKETIGRSAIIASILGLAGVAVILSGRLRGDYDPKALLGAAAVLLSATLFAWNLILQKQQAAVASPVEVAFFQHLVMLGVFAGGAPFLAVAPDMGHVPLIFLAAALAFTSLMALSWAYARAEAQYLIPVEYTAFIWAAIMGWLTFGERLTLSTLAGTALIVAGCLIAARRQPEIAAHVETGAV